MQGCRHSFNLAPRFVVTRTEWYAKDVVSLLQRLLSICDYVSTGAQSVVWVCEPDRAVRAALRATHDQQIVGIITLPWNYLC